MYFTDNRSAESNTSPCHDVANIFSLSLGAVPLWRNGKVTGAAATAATAAKEEEEEDDDDEDDDEEEDAAALVPV